MNTLTLTLTLLLYFNTCRALECTGEDKTYFADISTGCQVYHVCEDSELKTLRCPSGQAFDRQTTKCEDASTVPCYVTLKRSIAGTNVEQNRLGDGQATNVNSADLARSTESPVQTAKAEALSGKIEINVEQPPKKEEEPRSWVKTMNILTLTLALLLCFFNTCRALECAGEDKTYIADISTGCQVYHICDHSEVKTLRCSSGQAFNSQTTKCEDASTVPCYLTLKRSKVDMSFFNRFVNGQPTNSNSADLARSIEIPLQTAKEAAPAAKIEIHIEQPPKKAEEPRSWIDGFGLFHIVAMGVLLLVILCCFMCCGCCLCIHYIGAATCDFIEESSNIKRQDRDCVKQDRNSAKQTRIKI